MGYTHYWSGRADATPELLDQIHDVIDHSYVTLADGLGGELLPTVDETEIWLNGSDELGEASETFMITFGEDSGGFCKTGRRPYDEVVVAILILLARHCPEFTWSSDGDTEDHADGMALVDAVTL